MTQPVISAIGTANPPHLVKMERAFEFMSHALELTGNKKTWLKKVYESTGIETRYSVLKDFSSMPGKYCFFPNTRGLEPFPAISDRMGIYKEFALPLALDAIKDCCPPQEIKEITHLITVSCTGMYAPGIDIEIIQELGLNPGIERTAVNFMGCYAAFNALKLANHICRSKPESKILIVCVELCSIHFLKTHEKDNLIACSLFGDGAAAALVRSQPSGGPALEMEDFKCSLIPNGSKDMAWQIGDFGFEMALSSYVPDLIKGNIKNLVEEILVGKDYSFKDFSFFATHPGGKKILENIEEELNISPEKNLPARNILKNYGNMSSPTVLFVIKEILKDLTPEDSGKMLLSMAFGPGLTVETGILKVVI